MRRGKDSYVMQKGGEMNTFIIYDSQFGNTERIAKAIANTLSEFGQARAVHINQTQPNELGEVDLLILGCPTQGWRPTKAMQSFLEHISPESLGSLSIACFDTRFQKPRWMTGSAAEGIARKLRKMTAEPLLPPESFFVNGTEGPLDSGEEERAAKWALMLHEKYEVSQSHLVTR